MAEKKEKRYVSDNAQLMAEWNWGKNNELGLFPDALMCGSGKKVWWKCVKGHEWEATICRRNRGRGCPYCSSNKVLQGYNDLRTLNPMLAKEWNYEKNGDLKPENFTANSGKKVWWKCVKGHEWQAPIYNRNKGVGCPVCNSERNTSFPEYAILYYLKKYGLDVIHSYKEQGYELDIYIPSKRIAIEYDGYFWHKNKTKKDLEKNQKCEKDGIKLYRIREELPPLNDSSIEYIVQKNQKDLPEILAKVLSEIIGVCVNVNLEKDAITIENLREYSEKESSLLFSDPEIAKEWNYEKNGNLKPENYTSNSGKKVWWKCSKGHEWQARIAERNRGNGCPYCSGRYAVKGENDLQTVNLTLAKEWNYEKNGKLKPENYTSNSGKKVWWKCSKGHEWQATIHSRNSGIGCPYCAGRYAIKGENDLQTLNPALAKEWNYERNSELTPTDISPNSSKKAWWKCSEGHEWQAIVSSRNSGHRCPYCSGRYVIKGKNDLQTLNPTLAKEWNYEKNSELTPMEVSPNSGKKAWWKCSKGHEWQATIVSRKNGNGCPYCSGKYVVKGKNDLQSVNPKLAKEWNFEKNDRLTPNDVSPNSGKKVWWKCSKGHEWQAVVSNRNKGSGCPHCYKEKFFKDK
ncbi:MAG: zinc-ribbon domain-containing protein [Clostridia bacterium]|nr:zinc-ribbon domain-containing protein [Clostridia bacterium]